MVIDYKDVSFSFGKIKKQKRQQRIRLMIAAAIGIIIFLLVASAIDSGKVKKIQALLLEGKTGEAASALEGSGSALFHRGSKKELTALLYLISGQYDLAQPLLDELARKSTLTDHTRFLDYFAERAEYKKLQIYSDYLDKKYDDPEEKAALLFYKAQARTGQLDPKQSAELLRQLPPDLKKTNEKAIKLLEKINGQMNAGKVNYIFDINGAPLAYYDIEKKTTVSMAPGINFAAFNHDIAECMKLYRLTIDKGIQDIVHRLFRNYNGSFLLMNVSDSGIVAAYSKPLAEYSTAPTAPTAPTNLTDVNTVFSETYEPGSIIKLLTLFAYLKALQGPTTATTATTAPAQAGQTGQPGQPGQPGTGASSGITPAAATDFFPFECEGSWNIEGSDEAGRPGVRIFYDWLTHHRIENCEEALAFSCNIAFAKMGVMVGTPYLCDTLNRFYFNADTRGTPLTDLFLTFKTGKYRTDIPLSDRFRLCNLAVGLNEISVTTFHAALFSTIISQNGSIYDPYMITNKKNLLNIAFYNHNAQLRDIFQANTIFLKIKDGMRLAVESDRGTGKRAQVDFVHLALKTGTAGDKSLGLDAILTGFFPAEKPQYAFAFRLERAGKAEWQGAMFLKEFLSALYQDRKPNIP